MTMFPIQTGSARRPARNPHTHIYAHTHKGNGCENTGTDAHTLIFIVGTQLALTALLSIFLLLWEVNESTSVSYFIIP